MISKYLLLLKDSFSMPSIIIIVIYYIMLNNKEFYQISKKKDMVFTYFINALCGVGCYFF